MDHTPTETVRPEPANRGSTAAPRDHFSRWVIIVPLALLLGLLGWGAWSHWATRQQAARAQEQAQNFEPSLRYAVAKREDGPVSLNLPGTTAPFDSAKLYARATGYIAERRVDIGSHVRKGDLMLRIAAPDLTAQLAQANAQMAQMQAALVQSRANVTSARSNVDLARVTNSRTSTLARQGWETKQNADNSRANVTSGAANVDAAQAGVTVAEANVAAQAAAVQRLQALVGFLDVTAPFDGVVTSRGVSAGDLVQADAGSGTPLFALDQDDVLRVQVQMPQSAAIGLKDGLAASVTVPELPGQAFAGHVARNAVALDPSSRAVLVEVDLPNGDGKVRAGLYVNVTFEIPRAAPGIVIPDEAVIFNGQGLRVAVIGDDDVVHMREVKVFRDMGTTVELHDGLNGGERVALSPPVDLMDAQKVQVQAPTQNDASK